MLHPRGPGPARYRSVVDLLTCGERRTAFTHEPPRRLLWDFLGINSVRGAAGARQPIVLGYDARGLPLYERGFGRADGSQLHLIDAQRKLLRPLPARHNLFYDLDKVMPDGRYEWHGTFAQVVEEFLRAGYRIDPVA